MKFRKLSRITVAVLGMMLAVSLSGQGNLAQAQAVKIDGKEMYGINPIKINNHTLIPMRPIFEGLDANVQWNGGTKSITATTDELTVLMQIGSSYADISGRKVLLDQAPILHSGRTMVPLRFVAEALGASVDYDNRTQTTSITTSGAKSVTLDADKQVYIPNEPMKLAFTAPPGMKARITIYMVSADLPADPKLSWGDKVTHQNILAKTQGVLEFNAPKELGNYEFRAQDKDVEIMETISFEVQAQSADRQHQVWLDRKSFREDEKIPVHFESFEFQNPKITLVRTDVPRGNPEVNWKHARGLYGSHANLWGKTQGVIEITGIRKAGTYEARLDDGYGNEITHSEPFTVTPKR